MHLTNVYTRVRHGPQETLGISNLQRLQSDLSLPASLACGDSESHSWVCWFTGGRERCDPSTASRRCAA